MKLLFLLLLTQSLIAQEFHFPRGVGGVGVGHRHYAPTTETFNGSGEVESLGAPLSKKLDAETLLSGDAGGDLEQLAKELLKWNGGSRTKGDLLDSLYLGELQTDVKSEVDVSTLMLVMGLTDSYTSYIFVPWVKASVDVDIAVVGNNRVSEISGRLSDYAFGELQSGLQRAANFSAEDIIDGITEFGYEDPSHWEYEGVGDIEIGGFLNGKYGLLNRSHKWALKSSLSIPTGYYESADRLSDISISNGYFLLTNQIAQEFRVNRVMGLGTFMSLGLGLPTQVEKRVPENNEIFVAADRKTTVDLTPGQDIVYGVEPSAKVGWFKFLYEFGAKHHFKDSYSGNLEGNYDALAEGSDTYELYQQFKIRLDTVKPFMAKKAAIPIGVQAVAHFPIQGKNRAIQQYYELAVASVFSTPFYKSPKKKMTKKKKRKRSKSKRVAYK